MKEELVSLGVPCDQVGTNIVDDETGTVSLALLSAFEPLMNGFASFEGGAGAGAPVLRLLFTVANGVGLP